MNQNTFQSLLPSTPPASQEPDAVLDFGKIFSILRHGWWVIAATGLAGGLLATIMVLQIEPTYSARAQLLMGQTSRTGDVLGALVQDLNLDDDAITGEIAIITSGRVLSKVSARLDLASRPEFNAALRPPEPETPVLFRFADLAFERFKLLLGAAPSPPSTVPETDGTDTEPAVNPIDAAAQLGKESLGDQADYVGQLMSSLRVNQLGNTVLVDVRFLSTDRLLAAAVPNAVVDIYLEDQLNRKFEALRRLTEGLESRLSNMRGRLENSERAVIEYRNQNLADGFAEQGRLDQQLLDLARRLNQATADQAELASQVKGLEAIIEERSAVAAAGLFDSPLIDNMRSQVIELRQRQDLLRERSTQDSAQVRNVDVEIERLESMIAAEVARLLDDQKNRAELESARVAALRAELQKLEARAIQQAERQVRLTQLNRNLAAANAVYGTFLDKFTETSESLDLQEGDAQIIAYAEPPSAPVAPDKKVAIALGGIAGAFAGTGLVFLMALIDTRVRNRSQLQALIPAGVPVLTLPRPDRFAMGRSDPLTLVTNSPESPMAEGIRTIRSQLMLSEKNKPGRVVAVGSTRDDAGRTATSLLLARSIAQMGISCVIVDADLRRAEIARRLDLPAQPDLIDVLDGRAPLEAALQRDPGSPARVLTARKDVSDAAGILLSESMTNLIQDLRRDFQVIIIDTTPVIPVSDAAPLIRTADNVLLMVRYGTPQQEVVNALEILNRLALTQISIVLSMVPRGSTKALKGYGSA